MTTTEVILLIAGIAAYVGFLAFVLALLTAAKHADEAAEHHARVLSARNDSLPHPKGDLPDGGFTAADLQFPGARPARGTRIHEPDASRPATPRLSRTGSWARGRNMG